MFNKMSHSVWSRKLQEEEKDKKTSQMDRMVAAGWFDLMLLDRNFKFRSYTRNVPRESLASNRSREISSPQSSSSTVETMSDYSSDSGQGEDIGYGYERACANASLLISD
uniref:Uncharacterized protein n=1 Tax=Favella ehrenbergii TaxID=182087 RepID=A0A7S3HVY2_9SPIT|mmetsp:Transcript_13130/g.16709  ORF Transcript_13130/g.16709 Transcript_13130/m.16709 type:complete len:110 (+) Transcript_13130:224-553(+)